MMKIGIVGTGMLGEAVGLHLLDVGYKITVFNRSKEKTEKLENKGALVVDSPKNVAENSELVIMVVKDANAVKDVVFGDCGILAGRHEGMCIADMSTINPNSTREISKKVTEDGIDYMEIPVMGGPNVAINGKLVIMASGKKEVFEKFKTIFESIADQSIYLGDTGTAHSIKLAMNLQIAMLALSLSEGITLTKKAGFDPEIFLKVLNSTYFKTGMSEGKAHKMINDSVKPTFTLANLKKDLDTINDAAESFDAELPMAKIARKIYADATDAGFGDIDYTGIISYIRKLSKE
ncbi:3-hydroxyisobutyrate dehydrogenase [Candidatus Nitrosopelagicus brevis]|uniref:3-hydroxyisobutyrate dehydrogenase n=1 Tax=Candidatus Nitrosopelagicus brevis TaxID=1410606 RepID=A0A0A7UZ01_9ARCH|nr:NAD(P)-dependent oxidoreductase [Candidatus Nitrosopelagicus brevis]AJA91853.1 NADP oxidoreductase coenzyme F420-dependent [Candidatus Nitrosopelagicus brevis]NMI83750.1 NAD(P)-dependent oxidoreductase [Candidatus Nitrosopelagicus brevis]PTL87811.1 3-hydroxyisobutyrate dehydrogenase [Candidatus Nitrosopelagicus brevis]|tara:strand:+ start:96 stop:971 length:876 start_codon:yes stop_codon:yes gene_type:complete